MASAMRTRWIPALVLLVIAVLIWWWRRQPTQYSAAYVGDQSAIIWNTTAQVRRQVAALRFGEKVAVLRRSGDDAEVRSDDGLQGWIDARLLMAPELWLRASDLLARVRAMPVQASGHTRSLSNVHVDPGRDAPRLFQFERNVPVVVLERRVSAVPEATQGASGQGPATPDEEKPKQEDWLLVMRAEPAKADATRAAAGSPAAEGKNAGAGADIPIAGWVLARFIELDPPSPISDYASSSGLRVVAWAVLNTVPDAGGERPQYLVAGAHGGEGQPCDFTALRVYTWGVARHRYETAYVESDLCGRFPISASGTASGAEFRFAELDESGAERVYQMKQTVVRRVRADKPSPRARG
jgi:hypothetical protein